MWGKYLPHIFILLLPVLAQPAYLTVTADDEVLFKLELSPGATWHIAWNHSVAGITVRDYYRWDGTQMIFMASFTPDFAAGLGHIPGRGRVVAGPRGYWLLGINEAVTDNSYFLRVGSSSVNHRLVYHGTTYNLSAIAAHRRVSIGVIHK
jgi:hypothetical protein